MLTLTGIVRAVQVLGGGINRKTGEVIPTRPVVQVEGLDARGLFQLYTLTVPNPKEYEDKVGQEISLPVRAWATGAVVNLSYEAAK
jgi:hypothetical protein